MGGTIQHRITDAQERLRAHAAIGLAFINQDDADLELWATRDPSLFMEELPRASPLAYADTEGWDKDWQKYGCWLAKAAGREKDPLYSGVMKLALKAGAHPDDKKLFGRDVLLDIYKWRNDPDLLSLALKHGASPDMPPTLPNEGARSVIRCVLVELRSALCRASLQGGKEYVLKLIECANLLLDAGAKVIDGLGVPRMGRSHPFLSGISLVAEQWFEDTSPWVVKPMQDLVLRLKECGAKIDMLSGYDHAPLVVTAIRCANMPLVSLLIQMGAKTDDADICREETRDANGVLGLLDEAAKAMGPKGRAAVLELVLKMRVAKAEAANNSVSDAELGQAPYGHARRRARAV